MYAIVRKQHMPSEMINSVILFEKEKADDQFFVETGVEEDDVDHSVKETNMEADEEYKKIVDDYAEKSKTFLAQR